MPTAANGQRDGRTVRAERTRQALVDALLSLLDEGQLQPTAERIAVRAGVSEPACTLTTWSLPHRRISRCTPYGCSGR